VYTTNLIVWGPYMCRHIHESQQIKCFVTGKKNKKSRRRRRRRRRIWL